MSTSLTLVFLITVMLFASTASHATNDDLGKTLLSRIDTSTQELDAIEATITQESRAYARKLDLIQSEIAVLRKNAAAVQRAAEEKTLGLEVLESRVEKWETQSQYQAHLLAAFVEVSELIVSDQWVHEGALKVDASMLDSALAAVNELLQPSWSTQDIVMESGRLLTLPTLSVGPVQVAFNPGTGEAGPLVQTLNQQPLLRGIFGRKESGELQLLNESGAGYLVFDPTLGNAYELSQHNNTIADHVGKGGVWAIPILFFGALSLIVAILKAIEFLKLPKVDVRLPERLIALTKMPVEEQNNRIVALCKSLQGTQERLIEILVGSTVSPQRDDLLVACVMESKHHTERYLGVVATVAAIAPLLGLLGTVSGMISTFKMMTIFGAGDASTVSGGISEALVTTELGLIVAIPSLIISALLTRKTRSYSASLETVAVKLSKIAL
ncbi:MotA/TolQ/ExbB proton channel family protein [Teredinibacter purpureus]|uniref:MotA/TolQ/ExbB proton channel family protein n=1 Tax=Teredinibacter purpureus TaxID=2731756 RepID=UPI0005F7EADD|nr:MotA/TolQ/ExbB proton channel family protein [Teredinibacter purpureus]